MKAERSKPVDKKSTKVDKKSTKILAKLLGSSSRSQLLSWFFSHKGEGFYVRQLNVILAIDVGLLSRELRKLEEIGILRARKSGREKVYKLNTDSPFFNELEGLVMKTEGVIGKLGRALRRFKVVKLAFIYGSFAQGKEAEGSDIDLLAVGGKEIKLKQLHSSLSKIEDEVGREINLSYFSVDEFKKRRKRDSFIQDVLNRPKILLIGKLDEP